MYRLFTTCVSLALLFAINLTASADANRKTAKKVDPLFAGKCTQVDSGFVYFKNRSMNSIAEELKVRGYNSVCITGVTGGKYPLAAVLKKNGIHIRLLIIPMNGTYNTALMPPGYEKWRMEYKVPKSNSFEYFCLNNQEFRAFKQRQLVDALLRNPEFEAIDLPEPQIPSIGGPEDPTYACFCDNCRRKFLATYPEETDFPNFTDPNSPGYWKTNKSLYKKWVDFRANTVTDFLNFLVNGPEGIRKRCPKVKVITWTLGCYTRGSDVLKVERESQGMDPAAVVNRVKPDAHCIQTDWPDWSMTYLPADYAKNYAPYVKEIRKVNRNIPVIMQADSGSLPNMHRSFAWLSDMDKAAKRAGFTQTFDYQYHLGSDFYNKSPRLASAKLARSGNRLTLVFDMYLDPDTANNLSNYKLSKGRIVSGKADGNCVMLKVDGVKAGDKITVLKSANYPAKLIHSGYKQRISGPATIAIKSR